MSRFIGFNKVGDHRGNPRVFLESKRLTTLNMPVGSKVFAIQGDGHVELSTTPGSGQQYTVSKRRDAGGERPVLDINSSDTLKSLVGFDELRLTCDSHRVIIQPSVRAFYIKRNREAVGPFKVAELFSGGGTLSAALHGNANFEVVCGVEIEPRFADIWAESNPNATLIQADIRSLSPLEVPDHNVVMAGIPCTDHSNIGRAKKGLAGRAERGNFGGLFTDVLSMVRHHRPVACLFENVPNYQNSPAGLTLAEDLIQMGYSWTDFVTEPAAEWDEPSDRRRWVGIATMKPGFTVSSPQKPFSSTLRTFMDAEDPALDAADCARIATTIEGLRAHNARHQAAGHGFGFTTINRDSTKCPTIVKSYHKISAGPFVETPYGLRLLRQGEVERIQGCELPITHYATAVEVYGQGVQTRVFREILKQLGEFLKS